ncbi:hypothetical protein BB561_003030 [Smittium simulii]|uniref:ACT domain-containing protein n=1 Tax=Smittium simulii TaxID=133385 RepID=A0A2T9YN94_9FUNG|nr:hypothetical protein BB561_003030 [Smittium simulii]
MFSITSAFTRILRAGQVSGGLKHGQVCTRRAFGIKRSESGEPMDIYQSNTSVKEHIDSLVQSTKYKQQKQVREYVFNCFMQDEPGILARCTGIMAGRGYNIDSLVVSKTEVLGLSRMTITLKGERKQVIQAQKQLEDLTQVWAVVDLTESKVVEREVLLVKVSLIGPNFVAGASEFHTPRSPVGSKQKNTESSAKTTAEENSSTLSEEQQKQIESHKVKLTIEANKRLAYLKEVSTLCSAKIVDIGAEAAIVELCAKSDLIDVFIKLIERFGILESARSGRMVMSSNAKLSFFESEENDAEGAEDSLAPEDLSHLPPS